MMFLVWRADKELGTFSEEDFRSKIFQGFILPTDVYSAGGACKRVSEYQLATPPPLPPTARTRITQPRQKLKGLGLAIGLIAVPVIVVLLFLSLGKFYEESQRQQDKEAFKRNDERQATIRENDALAATHKICIGMTRKQCITAWGYPKNVNRTVTAEHNHEQWVYGDTYVYFDDGILTSWQDSIGR